MRFLLLCALATAAACGPENTCPKGSVGAVSVTIDKVKDPTGQGECVTGTSSFVPVTIGGPQKLVVNLNIGADATGSIPCSGPNVTVYLDGQGSAFTRPLLFADTGYKAGGSGSAPPDTSCTLDWTGVSSSGAKVTGTFVGRLGKADHTDANGATVYLYADVSFGFSFTP